MSRSREYDENARFHDQRPLDKVELMFQRPGVCADAQCCKITWLEELASESNTIQAQEDIMSARVMASNTRSKLFYTFGMVS